MEKEVTVDFTELFNWGNTHFGIFKTGHFGFDKFDIVVMLMVILATIKDPFFPVILLSVSLPILIHELGHLIAAKLLKFDVSSFFSTFYLFSFFYHKEEGDSYWGFMSGHQREIMSCSGRVGIPEKSYEKHTRGKCATVMLMGPAFTFIMGAIALYFLFVSFSTPLLLFFLVNVFALISSMNVFSSKSDLRQALNELFPDYISMEGPL